MLHRKHLQPCLDQQLAVCRLESEFFASIARYPERHVDDVLANCTVHIQSEYLVFLLFVGRIARGHKLGDLAHAVTSPKG